MRTLAMPYPAANNGMTLASTTTHLPQPGAAHGGSPHGMFG